MNGKNEKLRKEVIEMKKELRLLDVESLRKLKRSSVDSKVCRLKKTEYDVNKMNELLEKGRIIVEVINEKVEKKVVIYEREEEEIKVMNYEEVMKGIKNVDSLRCIEGGKNEKFKDLKKIEKLEKVREWLLDRKKEVEGNKNGNIKISDIVRKIEDIKDIEELKKWLLEKEENK